MEQVSGYSALQRRLGAEPAAVVELSLAEIESIMGRPLPPSARGKVMRQWWSNTRTHSQARAWLDAGRKARVDVRNQRVAFAKADGIAGHATASESTPEVVSLDLNDLSWRARRLVAETMERSKGDAGTAVSELLDELASRRLEDLFARFRGRSLKDGPTGAEMIREDRDSR